MLAPNTLQKLSRLQPETVEELIAINRLARESIEGPLLELCSSCIDAVLEQKTWQPPRKLTDREKAFIAFTEQFSSSVSTVTDHQVDQLLAFATPDEVYLFVNALYVIEMTKRMSLVAGRILDG